jgi:proteic killer suppression protein
LSLGSYHGRAALRNIAHDLATLYRITFCVIGNRIMIAGFRDPEAATIWRGERSRRLPSDIQTVALRKLRLLNNAKRLDDVRVPPGNRLEALKGERRGQHAIRINDQWRICFVWKDGHVHEVEIVDYH